MEGVWGNWENPKRGQSESEKSGKIKKEILLFFPVFVVRFVQILKIGFYE